MILSFQTDQRVVVTGIGLVTSVGADRETSWAALQRGESGARRLPPHPDLPAGTLAATVENLPLDFPGQTKHLPMLRSAAREALSDAGLEEPLQRREAGLEPHRIGCLISTHMGDLRHTALRLGLSDRLPAPEWPWWTQWSPNSAATYLTHEFEIHGICQTLAAACASSLLAINQAARELREGRCDAILAGGSEAVEPLMAAGFTRMGVLATADTPAQACRPFHRDRNGFVMGEGAAILMLERMDHAVRRGADIYAEILGGAAMTDTHHITSLTTEGSALPHLLRHTLRKSGLAPSDVQLVSAHGTGTQQNDVLETLALRKALGADADKASVTATKSALGHLVNAAGGAELAIALLALRDGFAPPTLNLDNPDPQCDLDCTPQIGCQRPLEHALKTSIAFGGHLVATAVRRWSGRHARAAQPLQTSFYRRAA
ncbi:beta-ketoacyl-[acyl-carrier-protein] synthase family protein [Botrimarina hoheduenensis]|uniref:3-oxoacyl-[acyl-carrier-protein] synthase 2 n=1 Tax=Botrimarina hoheduenensis TaxID=2528000 RepID=A0A5C5W9Q7_9BACT|nr:beta-ketoacyl-[acyl-carrier-protein] synthase family protein [Botrimarina hoheduenensis]TWT47596.1 3-oxoacyl-[acyl-carrier-protein] synthase 2 [Botrimarina hoheduenensis]